LLFCTVSSSRLTDTPAHTFCISLFLTLFVTLSLCVLHSNPTFWFLFCSKLTALSSVRPFFFPTVASNSYSSWDRRTSWVYSTTCVQYLYISCYLSDNKWVLPYLLLRLLQPYN
jgi:hypothetical protein